MAAASCFFLTYTFFVIANKFVKRLKCCDFAPTKQKVHRQTTTATSKY